MTDLARLIAELDAEHRPDPASGPGCRICWPKDGGWPCVTRLVADELREVAGGPAALAVARALLDAWCTAANDGDELEPLRAQTLAWLGGS